MRTLHRYRRSLTWLVSLSSAAMIASFGATAVLAEDPACFVNGEPITQAQLLENPQACDNADEPVVQEPAPTEPAPTEPTPTEPAPVVEQPVAVDPQPAAPQPVAPAPTEPAPVVPTPPVQDPAPQVDDTTGTTKPVKKKPAAQKPQKPTKAAPARPGTKKPNRPSRPDRPTRRPAAPRPTTAVERPAATTAATPARTFKAAPFRDARLFREQFDPAGRIPAQAKLEKEQAELLIDAARGTGTSWATLAAVAWLESHWGDPSAGALVGGRLTDSAWDEYGTDGDEDGSVTRSSAADRARTLAVYLNEVEPKERAALEAYFTDTRREVVAKRVQFLADYYRALGKAAIVHGLEDMEARKEIEERVLANEDVLIYDGGRGDITAGLVDPRVLVAVEFLANRFGTATISSIISGHGVYTASGNVSLHSYGQAVDIAALDGESILGNQQPGSRTYQAVQELLLLPKVMQPAELISLWDMGGPSFAMADHHDHIHIGWKSQD